MKEVYLFQPNYKLGAGSFESYYLPYSIASLWSYAIQFELIQDHYVLKNLHFRREDFESVFNQINQPDVVAFSCYVWNWQYNLSLAKAIKQKFPHSLIVMGGPQIPDRSNGFFERYPFIDVIVHGEGEYAFYEILKENTYEHPDFSNVSGCTVNVDGSSRITPPKPRIQNLEDIPSPYLTGVFDSLMDDHPDVLWSVTIETNRGCPFSCAFCDWGSLVHSKVTSFGKDRVFNEFQWVAEHKMDYVYLADANFGIFKTKDTAIVDHVVELKKRYGFPKTFYATWCKNSSPELFQMIKKLEENQLGRGLTLSVQSMSPDVLRTVKRKNMDTSNLEKMFHLCNLYGVASHTEMILGLPEETKESWKTGLTEVLALGQHNNVSVWLCQILENAELNKPISREKHDIQTVVVENYMNSPEHEKGVPEQFELIISTRTMPFDDLVDSYLFAWLIINFHSFGWTQFYSRFLHQSDAMTYLEFYNHLLAYIESDSSLLIHKELDVTRTNVISFLKNEGLKADTFSQFPLASLSGNGLFYLSQAVFHSSHEKIWIELKQFFENLESVLDSKVPDDLFLFQRNFVTSPKTEYPIELSFSHNFHEYLIDGSDLRKGLFNYRLSPVIDFSSDNEYLSMLYYRRNLGFGKTRIELLSGLH